MAKKRSLKGKSKAAMRARAAHARKFHKSRAKRGASLQALARRRSTGKTMFGPIFSRKLAGKRTKKAKGHVPLKILERRLAKLSRIVAARGGKRL